jgi:hypothetical protein
MRMVRNAMSLVLMGMISFSFAQMSIRWMGSDGWGYGSRYDQQFSISNIQTVQGSIFRIDTITPMSDMATGIQFTVKTDNEYILVQLGPSWYILHQDMNLRLNDPVEVKGSKIIMNGKTVIMASEIKRTGTKMVLYLRDKEGIPYWVMWRKHQILVQ